MVKGSEGRYTAALQAAKCLKMDSNIILRQKQEEQVQTVGTSATPYTVEIIDDTVGPEISGETPQNETKVESPRPEISALINDPSGVDENSVQCGWMATN